MAPAILALVSADGGDLGDRLHLDAEVVDVHHIGHLGRHILVALLVAGAAEEVQVELLAGDILDVPAQAGPGADTDALLAAAVLEGLLITGLRGDWMLLAVGVHGDAVRGLQGIADELRRLCAGGLDESGQNGLG